MKEEIWQYVLINGKSLRYQVKNPVFEKGILQSMEDFKPFDKKNEQGETIHPTIEDVNAAKRKAYSDYFKKSFKNLIVLSGAGSSMDVGGSSMGQLWDKADEMYRRNSIDGFAEIRSAVKFTSSKKDLEALLSQIDGFSKFAGDLEISIGSEKKLLSKIKGEIFDLIKNECTIPKPSSEFPHQIFLEKLLQRKQTSPRVKVFTLNYDLLFEYAATDVNAVIVDGFSYTFPRTFSGRFFDYYIVRREGSRLQDEDNFIQRVFHLHKLHGSLNWQRKEEDDKIEICENPKYPLMVYPREAKYEDSYEQPFFEMMARFQRCLRQNDDTMLVCIGYSFNDKHINAAIEEALNQNPGFRLCIVDPYFDQQHTSKSLDVIKKSALELDKILMISETFTEFARYFPEIKTYEIAKTDSIKLNYEQTKK